MLFVCHIYFSTLSSRFVSSSPYDYVFIGFVPVYFELVFSLDSAAYLYVHKYMCVCMCAYGHIQTTCVI